MTSVIPGLEVAGAGTVALPLEQRQAVAIQNVACLVHYDKGTRTLVDIDVRHVWKIDAGEVTPANPEWHEVLQIAVSAVQAGKPCCSTEETNVIS